MSPCSTGRKAEPTTTQIEVPRASHDNHVTNIAVREQLAWQGETHAACLVTASPKHRKIVYTHNFVCLSSERYLLIMTHPWRHYHLNREAHLIKAHLLLQLMLTSNFSSISMTRFPLHFLQRSFSRMKSPVPPQSPHIDWICWTIPGPMGLWETWIPEPLQLRQRTTVPCFPPVLQEKTEEGRE